MIHRLPPSILIPLILLSVAFAVTTVTLHLAGLPALDTDSHRYVRGAQSLLEKGALLDTAPDGTLRPDPMRTPGYPLFLAAIGWLEGGVATPSAQLKTVLLQGLLWWTALLALILATTVGRPITRPRWLLQGFAAALLTPPVLVGTCQLMTDLPHAALHALGCAGVALLVHQGQGLVGRRILGQRPSVAPLYLLALATGLVLGAASAVRPVGAPMPVLLALGALVWTALAFRPRISIQLRRLLLPPLILMMGVGLAPPVAWIARNHAAHGVASQSSVMPLALLLNRQSQIHRLTSSPLAPPGSPLARLTEETLRTGDLFHADLTMQREFQLKPFEAAKLHGQAARWLIATAPGAWLQQAAVNGVNLICAPADGLTLLRVILGPHPSTAKPLGEAVRSRDFLAVAFQSGLRFLGLALHLVLPMMLMITILRRPSPGCRAGRGSWPSTLRDGIRRVPLLVWLMLLTGGFVVVVSALATITYGRFALPLIPLLAALGAAAAMQPGPRR